MHDIISSFEIQSILYYERNAKQRYMMIESDSKRLRIHHYSDPIRYLSISDSHSSTRDPNARLRFSRMPVLHVTHSPFAFVRRNADINTGRRTFICIYRAPVLVSLAYPRRNCSQLTPTAAVYYGILIM